MCIVKRESSPDKGEVGKGNVVWFSRMRQRCTCRSCGRTFSYRRGTLFNGLRKSEQTVTQVVPLLAYGCPCQAIVAAFGLDERTVMAWQRRAGARAKAVHEAHIGKLDLQQVQADEMRIKLQGQHVLRVATRLWLGTVISPTRDRKLKETLAL